MHLEQQCTSELFRTSPLPNIGRVLDQAEGPDRPDGGSTTGFPGFLPQKIADKSLMQALSHLGGPASTALAVGSQ
jgi:hypothetical protein